MNVLLLCSQGMSTSMLCDKIKKAAQEEGFELNIWADSEIKARENISKSDIVLLGPQVKYLKTRMEEICDKNQPVAVIDMMAYGMMDGKKVFEDIKKLAKENGLL